MKTLKSIVQGLFVLSLVMCGIHGMASGSIWSCGGFFGWIIASVLVWVILCVALSPLILAASVIGKALGF